MNYFDILLAKKLEDDRDPKVEGLSVTENGRYHEDGVVYDPVIVNVPETPLSKLTVTENGTYTAPSGTAYSEVDVNVPLPENAYLLKDIENTPTAIATFSDGSNLPMPKLEVAIEPQQEGSGDPSPENIRPIIGWDEVNVARCGKNLVESTLANTTINTNGEINVSGGSSTFDMHIAKIIKGETYTVQSDESQNVNQKFVGGFFYDMPQLGSISYNNSRLANTPATFTAPIDGYVVFRTSHEYATPQCEVGNQSTEYTPYNPNSTTYTIDLDGTRYGGKVDLVSGVMTITHEIKKVNTLNWYYLQNTFYTSSVGISADGSPDINSDFVCSFAKSVNKEWSQLSNNECTLRKNLYSQGYYSLCVKNTEYSDATDFKNSLDSTSEITFPLATPLTIQLTPTVVKSLRGRNNVWADTGNILDLSYLAKEE